MASLVKQYVVGNETVLIGLCSVLALVATSVWVISKRWAARYPPGPIGLPIIGHLHLLGSLPHHTFAHLSDSHGPLLSLRFGSVPVIVASSPAVAKLILHTHDRIFCGRLVNSTAVRTIWQDYPNMGCVDIAFSLPGPYWKFMRQLCFTELFSAKRLNYFKPVRAQEMSRLMLSVCAAQGAPLFLREKLVGSFTNVISRMALGETLEEVAWELPNSENITETLGEMFKLAAAFNVGDYIPWLAWMDVQRLDRKSKKAARITRSVFQHLIHRRRSSRGSSDEPARDFLDALLLASSNNTNPELQISDANIRAVLIDMFSAGTDTSAITVEWALTELLINPPKLQTLQEELDQVVGRCRLIQETDLPNLPYLRAVVNETLRLHPSGPLLVPHMSMESSQMCGYQIPKHTLVFVNVWAIHRDPSIWDNPLEFYPERFLGSNTDALTHQCKFLPFGTGRRACPGAMLGLLNVQYVLANLVHAFSWRTLAKPNIQEKFGLVLALKDPLVIIPQPKLPKALHETLI